MTTTQNVPTALPQAEIDPFTYVTLVEQYKRFAKASAQNVIKLAETLALAQAKLSEHEFSQFCSEVRLKKDRSTLRKLMMIGKNISRFEPFLDRLPNKWTTLYKLASLDDEKYKLVTGDDRFRAFMTGKEIDLIVGASPRVRKVLEHDVVIDLNGLDNGQKLQVFRQLRLLKEQFSFQLTLGQTLEGITKVGDADNDNVPNGTATEVAS